MVGAFGLARSVACSRGAADRLAPALPLIAVLTSAVIAAGWYATLLIARDSGLRTPAYDQAFFQQLVWNLDHGRWFQSSFTPGSFLGLHFEPLLIIPAALERIWPDPRLLSLLAAFSIAALAPAAYVFLRALVGKPGVAAALAAPLPLWPALQEAARAGFHPEMIGLDLALLAGWAGLRGRTFLCWLLAFASLCAKEDQAWNVLVIGLVIAGVRLHRRLGAGLATVAIAWGIAVTTVVMPILRGGNRVDTESYYAWLREASPGSVVHALTSGAGGRAALVMLLCTGGLALLQPKWLLLAVPPFLANLLSHHDPQPALHLQYALPLVIPVLIAAAMAVRMLAMQAWLPAALAGPALILALSVGALPPAGGAPAVAFEQVSALDGLAHCVRVLPVDAPVAADDSLLPWLASRSSVHELSQARPSDYLVIDRQATNPAYVVATQGHLRDFGNRPILYDDGRFMVAGPKARR